MNVVYNIKIKSKYEVYDGIALKKDKIYYARDCGKGWFALIDEEGEEYAYPPELFEVIDDSKRNSSIKTIYTKLPEKPKRKDVNIAVAGK